ncbi:MAG: hypothetical protein HYZ75_12920 [Elusimicrobia bacterium]|nr:hypothetical protein [Elusimicrobiota bacterium]
MKAVLLLAAGLLLPSPARAAESPLLEMKARKVVSADATEWSPEETATLRRLRRAEAWGALQYLRDKTGTLDGSAVELPSGKGYKRLLLTVRGHDNWLFILSQEARAYFESKGGEAKYIFQLTDLEKKRFFDDEGMLTDHGVATYRRIRRRQAVYWINTDGRPQGTIRPPLAAQAVPRQAPAPPPPPPAPPKKPETEPGELPPGAPVEGGFGQRFPADAAAGGLIDAMVKGGAVEITEEEAKALAASSQMSQEDLLKTSLQAVPFNGKMRFYLKPGDPLAEKLLLLRQAQR